MTQADRDRLVALKKAASGAIRQRQAVEELKLSERQVRRLLVKLRRGGDQAILHGLRGRRSNRKMAEEVGIRTFLLCPDRAGGGTWEKVLGTLSIKIRTGLRLWVSWRSVIIA
jgi:hypothetical protein